jgi:hypothetical protein
MRILSWIILSSLLAVNLARAEIVTLTPQRLTGTLDVTWRCSRSNEGNESTVNYSIVAAGGERTPLVATEQHAENWLQKVGAEVSVEGVIATSPTDTSAILSVQSLRVINASGMLLSHGESSAAAPAPRPYLTILCQLAGAVKTSQKPRRYFEKIMTSRTHGIERYFAQISNGGVSLVGSVTTDWLDLGRSRKGYMSSGEFDTQMALQDALAALPAALDARKFAGIIIVFNDDVFGPSVAGYGGRSTVEIGGEMQSFGVCWVTFYDQALLAHELGHTFGLPHSAGSYGKSYDSRWDVMSQCYIHRAPGFGFVAQDTIAYHKVLLGWIAPSRICMIPANTHRSISLTSLSDTLKPAGFQIGVIPLNASGTRMYTVEMRSRRGYDRSIPGNGVVLHLVDTMRADNVAQVVDVDGNGNPNDAAARWINGELFVDTSAGVRIAFGSTVGTAGVVDIAHSR